MTTKRYEFTGEAKEDCGVTLKQIRRLINGEIGGWIKDEDCLPQGGEGWVYSSAMIYGGEIHGGVILGGMIYGGVILGGNIYGGVIHRGMIYGGEIHGGKIYGGVIHRGMIVTRDPIFIILPRHSITVADNMAAVGCEVHDFLYWREHIEEIGKKHRYRKADIAFYKTMLFAAMDRMEAENAKDAKKKGQKTNA